MRELSRGERFLRGLILTVALLGMCGTLMLSATWILRSDLLDWLHWAMGTEGAGDGHFHGIKAAIVGVLHIGSIGVAPFLWLWGCVFALDWFGLNTDD